MFSRDQILIVISKDQVQHSAIENSVLNNLCFAECLTYCTLDNKSNEACEYQPYELDDNLTENNHEKCSYPPKKN